MLLLVSTVNNMYDYGLNWTPLSPIINMSSKEIQTSATRLLLLINFILSIQYVVAIVNN